MEYKAILNFVKRANYGKKIIVLPGYDMLDSLLTFDEFKEKFKDDEMWCATVPLLDKEDGNVYDTENNIVGCYKNSTILFIN